MWQIFRIIIIFVTVWVSSSYATTYPMPQAGDDIIGQVTTIQVAQGDTFDSIAARYGLSFHELAEANPQIDYKKPLKIKQTLVIPTQFILPKYHQGIVINLPELRLYYFTPDGRFVKTYPLGLGRRDWRTPVMETKVIAKKINPAWNIPKSIRQHAKQVHGRMLPTVIPSGRPDNPLGTRGIYLAKRGYLIHGTNQPYLVGKYISSGCIRMRNEDVEELYDDVTLGTPVYIVNWAQKAGWHNGELYLESHRPLQMDGPVDQLNNNLVENAIQMATDGRLVSINWAEVDVLVKQHTGIPHAIGGTW